MQRSRYHSEPEEYGDVVSYTDNEFNTTDRGSYLTSSYHKQCIDVVTPNFRRKMARGDIVNNPCRMEFVSVKSDGSGSYEATNNDTGFVQTFEGQVTQYRMDRDPLPTFDTTIDAEELKKEAKLRALSQVDSTPYAFAEDAAEVRETVKFLKRPWGSLADLMKSFAKEKKRRQSRVKSAKAKVKALADVWTAYRFAASPLVRSSSDLVDSMLTVDKPYPTRRTARGFSYQTKADENSSTEGWHELSVQAKREVQVHASCLYEVTNPVTGWRQRYGLRNKDIPETIWAVLPYSFMVDRVVNISDVVGGLVTLSDPGVKILAGSVRMTSRAESLYWLSSQSRPGWSYSTNGNQVVYKTHRYNREVWRPSVTDALNPRIHPSRLVGDVTSILDLSALILQRLK